MRALLWFGALVVSSACSGEIGGGDDAPATDAGAEPVSLTITAPAPGSQHARDFLDQASGFLTADVPVAVAIEGSADAVEIVVGDQVLGPVSTAGELLALLRTPGPVTVSARALRGGEVVAEASVAVQVIEPTVADCQGWLELYQLDYTLGPSNQGVANPVTVTTPINGMVHRYISNTNPRATFYMDCTLALSLAKAAPYLRARGIVEVADIGVYNYRCIGGGTPPDCPNGISQHAYAKAIDIAGLTDTAGNFYSVEDDWVIDPDAEDTCAAPAEAGADLLLHQTICELKAAGVWNIVLTPNYNSAHRDHWHVDLSSGSDFIEHQLGSGVDVGPDAH